MGKVVVGQNEIRDQCVIALLCRGHVLLEGVPGIAKTLIVKTLSRLMRLGFQRVQCTSDLMPADIVGTNILNMATSAFQLHQGPVFTDLLLVDEVNRMPPRTQAALLECMEEHQVTIDGNGLSALSVLHGFCHPESGRIRRHLSAPRSSARPLPVKTSSSISQERRMKSDCSPMYKTDLSPANWTRWT